MEKCVGLETNWGWVKKFTGFWYFLVATGCYDMVTRRITMRLYVR